MGNASTLNTTGMQFFNPSLEVASLILMRQICNMAEIGKERWEQYKRYISEVCHDDPEELHF